jgi:polysaccharide export outer membrane protein
MKVSLAMPTSRMPSAIFVTMLIATTLSACATPRAVASLSEVQNSAEQGQVVLVPVTAQTLPPPPPFATSFPPAFLSASDFDYDELGPGDRLNVRIWETGTQSVFAPAAGGGSDLGELTVDESGRIYIPYAGQVRVSGLTISQARSAIIGRLRTVVANPQVDLRAAERRSALVSVQGDAAKTGSFPIARGRTRLGELLAEVAPSQKNPEILQVTLRRDGQSGTVRLSDVYANPALDVALKPGDSVILSEVVENVTILGAAGVQGQVRIPERDFTLVDALGQARGIDAQAADPRAVFVMRAQAEPAAPPLVYQFDMRRPQAIALANRFVLRDNDAVLISNSSWAQTRSVITAFAQSMATVRSVATIPTP